MTDSWNYRHLPTLYSILVLISLIPILLMIATYDDFHSSISYTVPDSAFQTVSTVQWKIKDFGNGTNYGAITVCKGTQASSQLLCTLKSGDESMIFAKLRELKVPEQWIKDSGYIETINGLHYDFDLGYEASQKLSEVAEK